MSYRTCVCVLFMCLGSGNMFAQERLKALRIQKVYVVNGMGWGVPTGSTKEFLSPKFSGSLGLDIGLKNDRYFLYPFLDKLVFGYKQLEQDPAYAYTLDRGRSNFYTLNLTAGIRSKRKRLNGYAFAGPGISLFSEPRANVRSDNTVVLKNHYKLSPAMRIGGGADYELGNVLLFTEFSYSYYFRKIQERPMHAVTIYGGLKTNITRVADKVVEIINEQTLR